jgi:transmembrane sensor
MRWPFVDRHERARREAADWVARLNGSRDDRDEAEFSRWYRASEDNAAAYDRLAGLFDLAREIRPARMVEATKSDATRRGAARPVGYALAAAAALGAAILAFVLLGDGGSPPDATGGGQVAIFAASSSEARRLVLIDGSEVVLSPNSELDVRIDGSTRRLTLERGEGLFTVFHDSRPFVVVAQGAEVVAHGTQFIVRIDPGGTLVSLIEGRVEVSYPAPPGHAGRQVTNLSPGDRLVVPMTAIDGAAPGDGEHVPPPMMIAFDDTPLGAAIEQVNSDADRPVRLAAPALAGLRITGAFRRGDSEGFARAVAAALDLEVRREGDGALSLWPRDPAQ